MFTIEIRDLRDLAHEFPPRAALIEFVGEGPSLAARFDVLKHDRLQVDRDVRLVEEACRGGASDDGIRDALGEIVALAKCEKGETRWIVDHR